ncbi:MAG: LuxR C-terminal-related transcriptional regulator [Pseudomonadota bacterium]
MSKEKNIEGALQTIQLLYEASYTPKTWGKILDVFKTQFSADMVQLSVLSTATRQVVFEISTRPTNIPLHAWATHPSHFRSYNQTELNLSQKFKNKVQLFSESRMHNERESPVLRTVMGPVGVEYAYICQWNDIQRKLCVIIGFLRNDSQGAFGQQDFEKFAIYEPHIYQSLQCFTHIQELNASKNILYNIFNNIQLGMLVVDCEGYLQAVNETARHLIDQSKAFQLTPYNRFAITNHRLKSELMTSMQNIVHSTKRKTLSDQGFEEHYMRVAKDEGEGHFLLIISALNAALDSTAHYLKHHINIKTDFIVIHIIDIEEVANLDPVRLQNAFNITATEADVLKDFADGQSPKEIAKKTQRSYYTIRNHLQKVMSKTNIHRQAELIRVIYSIMSAGRMR